METDDEGNEGTLKPQAHVIAHLGGYVLDELRHGRDDEDAVRDGDVEVVEVHAHHEPHQSRHHERGRYALQESARYRYGFCGICRCRRPFKCIQVLLNDCM